MPIGQASAIHRGGEREREPYQADVATIGPVSSSPLSVRFGCSALAFAFHFRRLLMRSDLTDITLVVDRSGSMASVRDDARRRRQFVHRRTSQGAR